MTETTLTPVAQALVAYHESVAQVVEAMMSRDEAWANYQRARAEQARALRPPLGRDRGEQ